MSDVARASGIGGERSMKGVLRIKRVKTCKRGMIIILAKRILRREVRHNKRANALR